MRKGDIGKVNAEIVSDVIFYFIRSATYALYTEGDLGVYNGLQRRIEKVYY